MIEDFIATLGRSLPGPRRPRQRLLAEAQAGLADAVQTYLAAGMDTSAATAHALADFGTVSQVAAHFQAELGIVRTRRTAALTVVLWPLLTLFWNVTWELNPYPTWQVPSVPFVLAVAASALTLAAFLHATAALVVTGRYGRGRSWAGMQHDVRLLGRTGTGAFAATALMLPAVDPSTLLWPPTTLTILAAVTVAITAIATGRRRPGRPPR
ncbi:MAG: hypothetical protein DLM59_08815 [Pseudonocardiales bacterium]|nr:MAG: hypothetical protein DLM59_08815 [Pseudonocardiales bacterium]